jgi:hypothetical protein
MKNIRNKVKYWLYNLDNDSALLDHICFIFRKNKKFNEIAKPNIFLRGNNYKIEFHKNIVDRILCKSDFAYQRIYQSFCNILIPFVTLFGF